MSERERMSHEEYEELLKPLGKELSAMTRWVSETKQRMIVLFEGRDAAGKGGSIDMFARMRERTQWYFQRYVEHLPAQGEIVLFDRSWYNRAGVERVMGFCTVDQAQDFLNQVPQFERHLVDDGMLFFKYWLCCDQDVQEERFENRLHNPIKRWKLSPVDIKAREHYDDYTEAREMMLSATHTDLAPWTLVDFNDQALGRLTLLRDLLDRVPDTELPLADIAWPPLSHEPLKERYGVLQPIPLYVPPPEEERKQKHRHRHEA